MSWLSQLGQMRIIRFLRCSVFIGSKLIGLVAAPQLFSFLKLGELHFISLYKLLSISCEISDTVIEINVIGSLRSLCLVWNTLVISIVQSISCIHSIPIKWACLPADTIEHLRISQIKIHKVLGILKIGSYALMPLNINQVAQIIDIELLIEWIRTTALHLWLWLILKISIQEFIYTFRPAWLVLRIVWFKPVYAFSIDNVVKPIRG